MGSSDEVRTFVNKYARPCIVTNVDDTNKLYVLVNQDGASDTNCIAVLDVLEAIDVSFKAGVNVTSVSLYRAAGDYDTAQVRGWVA